MKFQEKISSLSKLYLLLVVLILGDVYLWYALPALSDQMRLLIVIISSILIIILGKNLTQESCQA
jgi:hypothetical protein